MFFGQYIFFYPAPLCLLRDESNTKYFIDRSCNPQGCHGPSKYCKVLELAKENSRPWKVLEFGLWSLKFLEWAKFSPLSVKINENELFVILGRYTYYVKMCENKNGGS